MLTDALVADAARRLARDYGLDLAAIGSTVLGSALAELRRGSFDRSGEGAVLDAPEAIAALFNVLPVGLSWIDRDPAQLRSAAAWAAAQGHPLRVLSAPCARGEEVWSLAAALIDAGVVPAAVQILGVDAMPAAIAQAERGEYAATALRGRHDLPWWLAEDGGRLHVHSRLRPMARFRVANLLEPGLAEDGAFDLILSRNFLIYLTPEARIRWCRSLAQLLRPEGRLYTAAGEPIAAWTTAFAAIPGEVPGACGPAGPPRLLAATAPLASLSSTRPGALAVSRAESGPRPDAVIATVDPPRPEAPPSPPADPRALADAGQFDAAEALLLGRLACAVPAAEDLVTAGLLALARGRGAAAEDALRRALFVDHRHAEAAALLAALLDQRGEAVEAERLRRRAGGGR